MEGEEVAVVGEEGAFVQESGEFARGVGGGEGVEMRLEGRTMVMRRCGVD